MKSLILEIELVPQTCWYSNVRSLLSKSQWNVVRKIVAADACYVCEICGGKGPKHPVECHEIWNYNDQTLIQKLNGLIALCPNCHTTKHFGLATIHGRELFALNHLMKINGITRSDAKRHIKESFDLFRKRSQHQWVLDVSYLKRYGIDIDSLKI